MVARGEPVAQAGLRRGEVDTGHTDLRKSEFTRPLAQLLHKPLAVRSMTFTHPAILETRTFDWPDESACAAFAARLAAHDAVRDAFIELHGPLGAGKTTFTRHLLHALGVQGRIKSPTYAVMEPYRVNRLEISHFDFYRFADPREWEDAGFRDLFGRSGLKIAEWPENAAGVLPAPDLRLVIEPVDGPDGGDGFRRVTAEACTPTGRELLR